MNIMPRTIWVSVRSPRRHAPLGIFLLALCICACSRAEPATPARWTGTDGNLAVDLTLTVTSDSVGGQGTYTAKTPEDLRCGGVVLSQSGTVTFSGQLTSEGLGAHANFGSDWSPVYNGALVGKDTIRGGFLSGEGGSCPLVLVRQH
jgi:hypothetical protein